MEEKQVPESIVTVTKADYPPSEYCVSEPPPAYHKSQNTAVQVARIIAVTVVVVSFVLGVFMLATAYVSATTSNRQLEQELELLRELTGSNDDINDTPPQPQALIQDAPTQNKLQPDSEESKKDIKDDNSSSSDSSGDSTSDEEPKGQLKFPLSMDLDDLAGALMANNQKSKMNCIIEKKRSDEIVDHQPKSVNLPFGINLATDPRLERVTGEKMIIICESGSIQSTPGDQNKKTQPEGDEDDDEKQDTIMIRPIMIPIPHSAFQTHMPQQMPLMQGQEEPRMPFRPMHPMEAMRPSIQSMNNIRPVPPFVPGMEMPTRPVPQRPLFMEQRPPMMEQRFPIREERPTMMETRPQMIEQKPIMMDQRVPSMNEVRPIMRIIALRQNNEPVSQSFEPQASEETEQQSQFVPQQVQVKIERQPNENAPNPIIQHIIEQIIAQRVLENQKYQAEQSEQPEQPEQREEPVEVVPVQSNRLPIPEEVLNHFNGLSEKDRVLIAVSEPQTSEEDSVEETGDSQEVDSQTRLEKTPEVNRQQYMRKLPVNIPVNMMQQQLEKQEPASSFEKARPHYVQPRSV